MFKEVFIDHLEALLPKQGGNILELGSGTSTAVTGLLKRRGDVGYLGVEPSKKAYEVAKGEIGSLPNVHLVNDLAYDLKEEGAYDLCFSLSVLEHVKQLEKFLVESVKAVKPGGYIVHRYDLGHALTPSSIKERFQVFLGNHFPSVLSEDKFVCYLDPERVVSILAKHGAVVERITYHQMPEHKLLFKHLAETPENIELERKASEWEFEMSLSLQNVPKATRERLFPAIAIWAHKQ